jgi:hypothetical protein
MEPIVFRYRSRELASHDIDFIRSAISKYYSRGRSYISRVLCRHWNWVQPNGKLKEYPARDLLLRLEEKGFINLPPRLNQKNNLKRNTYAQIPIFKKQDLAGIVGNYSKLTIQIIKQVDSYLWNYLLHHYHYLGQPKLVGEHLKYLAYLDGQVVACISWASAAWKIKSREEFIGWDESTNNTRFLILPWIRVKHLASKVLALNLKRLSDDWQNIYNHRVYLVETFVDTSRFKGTCYKAANWQYVGQTSGSAKKGNDYLYHGQPKAVYLYSLHRNFRRLLNDDQG